MSARESAADRIRPFLKAMERSVNQARTDRLTESGQRPFPEPPRPSSIPTGPVMRPSPLKPCITEATEVNPSGRMKARPKRSNAYNEFLPPSQRQEAV